jgi:TonB-dependent starch-binding outer membrane protein SusC
MIFKQLQKMMAVKSRHCFALLINLLFVSMAFAQEAKVQGTVKENGVPLPGVNVVVKGTMIGTITDINGTYSLNNAPSDGTLVFSFVGYKTQEVPLNGRTTLDVGLEADITALDEITVVSDGYGTIQRADVTGSVASISADDLQKIPVASAAQALTGRLPGVSVTTVDGSPDADIVIRVRGGGSITQDNSPLYVVDGFIVNSIRDIPPTDIQSIDVLKDAAATAIYGAQASNGVVVVTTKKPKAGKVSVSYNGFVQFRTLPKNRKYEVLSPYEYVMANYEYNKLLSDANVKSFEKFFGKYDDLELYKNKKATDWQDELFGDPRVSQYHNLSLSGGTEKTKLTLSLTNNDEQGLIKGSGYNRTVINFKLNQEITKKLQLDVSTRITRTVVDGAGTSTGSLRVKNAIATRPTNGIADELDIDLANANTGGDDEYQNFLTGLINPAKLAEQDWRKRTTNSYVFNAGLTWKPIDGLTLKTIVTTETSFDKTLRYYGPLTTKSQQEGSSLPIGEKTESNPFSYRWLNTAGYEFKDLGIHKLDFLFGQEMYSSGGVDNFVQAKNFRQTMQPEELFANFALGVASQIPTYQRPEQNRLSFFGRTNYQLNNRYLFSATIRADASSKFSKSNRVGFFPAVALGWKINEESFMDNVSFVDELKLRVSYGATGNDRIPANANKFLFKADNFRGPGLISNATSSPFYVPDGTTLYNDKLVWETTINRNAGLDFTMMDARLTGSLDVYWNTTKDLLIQSAIPSSSGFGTQWNNIGSTSNRGVELALAYDIIDKDDLRVSMNANFGINRSKIDELDGTNTRFIQSNWGSTDLKDINDYYFEVGGRVGDMYGYVADGMYTVDDFQSYDATAKKYLLKDGIPDNKGTLGVGSVKPGYMKIKDLNGDGVINTDDRQIIGNGLPKAQGGFGFNATYKGFDASIFFNWSVGNDVYNTGKIEYNQLYRTSYGNMLSDMNSSNRFTYIDVDGAYTGIAGEVVTDLEQLREMNVGKSMWSGNNSFGSATVVASSFGIEDGSFLRLNLLSLGYSLPQTILSKLKMTQCRIYATGNNLHIWTKYSGYDPEVSTGRNGYSALTPGLDYSSYPKSRTYTIGVNVTF